MKIVLIILMTALAFTGMAQVSSRGDTTLVGGDSTVLRTLRRDGPITEISTQAPDHSPTRAALLAAIIPGLGQAYNKKYWKIPIVWGGLGAFGYFISWNNREYQYYRKMLLYEIAQDPEYPNETNLDQTTLLSARDYWRRNRDQVALYGILFYLLQIVDAHVDAHLIEFDVNQDLSVRIEPSYTPVSNNYSTMGLALKFKF